MQAAVGPTIQIDLYPGTIGSLRSGFSATRSNLESAIAILGESMKSCGYSLLNRKPKPGFGEPQTYTFEPETLTFQALDNAATMSRIEEKVFSIAEKTGLHVTIAHPHLG